MSGDTKSVLDFWNKVVLAPMVRIGTLPARLVALDCGADLVYTEEIIDLKILRCKRVENSMLGTVDYVLSDDTVAFRTCDLEKGRVVFQIGTANAERALKVAKLVEHDVAAIDLNMGCPKEYSTKGGCGAALLSQPENVKEILTTLVKNVSIPVTCKMRLLPTIEETLKFVKMVEETGVAAITVHGRLREERPRHPCRLSEIKAIAEAVSIPVIANGGSKHIIKKYEDIEKFRASCGAASVMLAREAQWDPSIFRAAGRVPLHDTCRAYVKYALQYDSTPTNIKYNVQQLLHQEMETPHGKRLLEAGTMYEISSIWDLDTYYDEKSREWRAFKEAEKALHKPTCRTLPDGTTIWEQEFRFYKREYPRNITPKYKLHEWARQEGIEKPFFETQENVTEQNFYSILTINGTKYASTLWDKSKRAAEQAAAAVFMTVNQLHDGRKEWQQKPNSAASQKTTANSVKSESNPNQETDIKTEDTERRDGELMDGVTLEKDAQMSAGDGRAAFKRSASMTEVIDDLIEKQIRLGTDDEVDIKSDASIVSGLLSNEIDQKDAGLIVFKENSEEKDET